MPDLSAVQPFVLARLHAAHQAREAALPAARRAIRCSANAIRAAHRNERTSAAALLQDARAALVEARRACAGQPHVEHAGFLLDAEKELAEAAATLALTGGDPLPSPDDVGVSAAAWLNGLAETVGELRRYVLDQLRAGELARSEAMLDVMDDIYTLLVTIDFPDAVTAGLRRSTDVARSILERTRGDLTAALAQDRLRDALEAHRHALERPS